jgi:DNA-binding transcriptional MocR family regulator
MLIVSEQTAWWERYKLAGAGASEIASGVEAAVTADLLVPGAALPPVRELAELLGVNPNTVAAAYRTLRDRGTVETRGRAGTRVRERPGTSARQRSYTLPEGVRDLTLGEPNVELLPELTPPRRIDASRYWHSSAEPVLEAELRRRLARNFGSPDGGASAESGVAGSAASGGRVRSGGVAASGDVAASADVAASGGAGSAQPADLIGQASVLPVFGVLDGIDRLLATHTRPGDKVAVEDPGWGNLLDLLASRGLSVQPMRVDDEGPNPDDLRAALIAGARAVVVTTRAQNPYGAVVSPRRAAVLRSVLAAYPDVLTIDDDHGADLTEGAPQVLCGVTRQWAYLYSASKAYGPDLRIAALVGDTDTVDRIAGHLKHTSRRVPGLMQEVWATALAEPKNDAVLAKASKAYAESRSALIDELARHGIEAHGESGLNVWIPVRDEAAAATGLLARGWAVAPGSWFRIRSGPGVRVTVATLRPEEAPRLAEAVAGAVGGAVVGAGLRPQRVENV